MYLFDPTALTSTAILPHSGRPLIVDSFAGGGGASTGIEMALGRSPDIAINHNAAALALHAANHPDTLHLSENIYRVDPLDYVRGRHVGLAHFSPDCKHFSKAKGGKPVERNIRDLAWVVVLWAERARPDVITMENVEEWTDWGPLIETERGLMPDPARRGETYQQWCKALRRLGYRIEKREIRACDFGAPTIRKRMFLVARCDGKPIVWPAPTHGRPDDPEVIAGRKKPWRTAAECIDWTLPCPSIFDSAKAIKAQHGLRAVRPLADATMARVARGLKRYVLDAARPFIVNVTHGGRLEGIDDPLNTITAAHRGEKMVTVPHLSAFYGAGAGGKDRSAPVEEPVRVVTTENRHAVVAPHLMTMRNSGKPFNGADEPTHTITAGGAGLTLVAPVLTAAQQGGSVRSVEDPHHTITASSKDQNSVIVPVLVQTGYGEREGQAPRALDPHEPLGTVVAGGVKHAAVVPTLVGCGGRAGQSRPRGGDEPVATITAKADGCVAVAYITQHNNDSRRDGGVNPGRAADAPVSTVTASGSQQGVVSAFIARQFGQGVGQGCEEPSATVTAGVNKSQLVTPHLSHLYSSNTAAGQGGPDSPLKTVTAGGGHAAVVAPFMQAYYGTGDGGGEDEPCRTITTKDRHGHVEAALAAPPFLPEHEPRAREVAAFLRSFGFWDEREFVTIAIDGMMFVVADIGMRMLTPRELYNAQGFPPDYIIDGAWDDQGGSGPVWTDFPKSVQVSCVGNSVSPPPYAAIVAANCGHLAEWREAAE